MVYSRLRSIPCGGKHHAGRRAVAYDKVCGKACGSLIKDHAGPIAGSVRRKARRRLCVGEYAGTTDIYSINRAQDPRQKGNKKVNAACE